MASLRNFVVQSDRDTEMPISVTLEGGEGAEQGAFRNLHLVSKPEDMNLIEEDDKGDVMGTNADNESGSEDETNQTIV